ncbi:GNAT family N-acetyltransferase [Limnohabitans sp. TS-CS-82]|uniref:GNAT family N-acetyltransferase n=1 Tax=Limnohabitans sp. TS-CS-82 TaxID=2094193 RepID=UPI001F38B02D|nr:GNAT family N-acetyltransferase [Limnohabitans sp. TS-CS-82]
MSLVQTLAKTTIQGGRQMLRFTGVSQEQLRKTEGVLIPIAPLGVEHLSQILKHLLTLSEHDRYLRFGYTATDEHVERYVNGLNFDRDEIYGIFNTDLEIIAMAHLALIKDPGRDFSSEFGVSVAAHARGRGYGARLFERAVIHARNEKVYQMYIHALSENAPMIRIARKGGAKIERDGSETEAYLRLPKRDLDSRVTEFVADQYAKTNYSIKEDAKRFWNFLSKVQEIREGVRDARHQAAE